MSLRLTDPPEGVTEEVSRANQEGLEDELAGWLGDRHTKRSFASGLHV